MEAVHKYTRDELELALATSASVVKLTCGVGNNVAIAVMLDAHDQIKKHPNYRHQVKYLYKQAIELFRQNERQLLHAKINRFFHVGDMSPNIRKKYGDITDTQYFEFWQGLGARAYVEGRPLLTSLHNKYRLSLLNHNVKHADLLAWPMVAQACLELACTLYTASIEDSSRYHHLPKNLLHSLFSRFNLRKVADVWYQATMQTDPKVNTYDLDEIEARNIEMGIQQLKEKWTDPKLLYGSAITATKDFDDIFRTKGENKKAIREITEILHEVEAELG